MAAHLHAVHTPWNLPGKAERKKRKRMAERQQRQKRCRTGHASEWCRENDRGETSGTQEEIGTTWTPSPQEVDEWEAKVLQICVELEEKAQQQQWYHHLNDNTNNTNTNNNDSDNTVHPKPSNTYSDLVQLVPAGRDRTGRPSTTAYRDSLPSFLQAAANGDLEQLKHQVQQAASASPPGDVSPAIVRLLDTRDRHGSMAEHWAAGNGQLDCLQYLIHLREKHSTAPCRAASKDPTRIRRRRDGKTALHYAARYGHLDCIRYLILECCFPVDVTSGEGTTPFHLACFGGHVAAAQLLLQLGAQATQANEWGCTAAHWLGMTRSPSEQHGLELCRLLQQQGVSFVERQKQGHSALHKAALHGNKVIVDWMAKSLVDGGAGLSESEKRRAGQADIGGHKPSDIWTSAGGDEAFAQRMRDEMNW